MLVKRKTRIGAISLGSLLAAAASIGLVTAASASSIDEAMEARAATLGFDAELFANLDEDTLAEIVALFEADHDDETLQREVGSILDVDGISDGDAEETAG